MEWKTNMVEQKNGFIKVPSFLSVPQDTSILTQFCFPNHTNAWHANHEIGDEVDIAHSTNTFTTRLPLSMSVNNTTRIVRRLLTPFTQKSNQHFLIPHMEAIPLTF
jgi:hypothetical protein